MIRLESDKDTKRYAFDNRKDTRRIRVENNKILTRTCSEFETQLLRDGLLVRGVLLEAMTSLDATPFLGFGGFVQLRIHVLQVAQRVQLPYGLRSHDAMRVSRCITM